MNLFARFVGEGAHADITGLNLATEGQHSDITLDMLHAVPRCTSKPLFKQVARGRSNAVFQGKIVVARDAQKTDAKLMMQGLMLSDEAEILSKPELEIFADDVVCGHGSTAGALDEDSLFYLMSRGIPKAEAETMLVRGFLAEVLDPIGRRGAAPGSSAAWPVSLASPQADELSTSKGPRRFPDPRGEDLRASAGLSRHRRLGAEAQGRARQDGLGAPARLRQRPPRPPHARQPRDRSLRGRPRSCGRFLNAARPEEIVFTRSATEAINLVASSFAGPRIGEGDEIVLTIMEHHSNIVPWHFLRERQGRGAEMGRCPRRRQFRPRRLRGGAIGPRTKMVAITHMSNVLGTVTP